MIRLLIDSAIPFIEGVFEPFADVKYMAGAEICHGNACDRDAIIIRSRTTCNAELLEGSAVKIIATTAIGTDHIDMGYCAANDIRVRNSSGSNAGGVMNYVFSALYGVAARQSLKLGGATIGIVGVGNVGGKVDSVASNLGFKVLRCDPPRAATEGPEGFCSLDELLEKSDIITLHVPLNSSTKGMADESFFTKMRPGAIFINAARGGIVDERALKAFIPKLGPVIIDTWQNEPDIDKELLEMVDIATPHIAAYSYQGKLNGTMAVVRAVAEFFGISELYDFHPKAEVRELESVKLDLRGKSQGEIASIFQYNYPIFTDDFMLRMDPDSFARMRRDYQYRREFYIE